jgi:hypothetical protein
MFESTDMLDGTDIMKVTTFYKPQSKSLKKCLIIRKMLEYHFIKIQGKKQLQ